MELSVPFGSVYFPAIGNPSSFFDGGQTYTNDCVIALDPGGVAHVPGCVAVLNEQTHKVILLIRNVPGDNINANNVHGPRAQHLIRSRFEGDTNGETSRGRLPTLQNVDAIFFLGHREVPLDQQQRADLVAFVHDAGKGFVAAHTALTAFDSWPEFGDLLGARYDDHPWNTAPGTIVNEAPSFPATRHFPATFALVDEFYQPKAFSREKLRVLLRLDVSKMSPNPNNRRTDGDFPLA